MEDFVHLHVHTYFSILDGQSSIKKLVSKAIDNGMRGMALTDHGNMFGAKELQQHKQKTRRRRTGTIQTHFGMRNVCRTSQKRR